MKTRGTSLRTEWKATLESFFKEENFVEGTKDSYISMLKMLQQNTLRKNLRDLTKEDLKEVFSKIETQIQPGTVRLYKAKMKKFYKWFLGENELYPENVKWIKNKRSRQGDSVVKKLLKENEVKAMLQAADHPRDKALIAVLYETGGRRGEVLKMLIRDLEPQPYGYTVTFRTGKTGAHAGPPITGSAAKFLRNWLEVHPNRSNPDSPLWTRTIGDRAASITKWQVSRIVSKIARHAGIRRNVHPHMFRHTRATIEAKQLNEPTMRILHGWSPNSSTPSVYIHLNGDDAVKQSLMAKGIIPKEQPKEALQELVKCSYCGEDNAFDARFCHYCGVPLKSQKIPAFMEHKTSELEKLLVRIEALEQKLVEKGQAN